MSEKIYEYRDDANWFIGKWGGWGLIGTMFDEGGPEIRRLDHLLADLVQNKDGEPSSYDVTVIRYQDLEKFLSFMLDMINENTQRSLTLQQHQGAWLIVEEQQLYQIVLPPTGLDVASFLGHAVTESPAFAQDRILIATKNEGKTKEFRAFFEKLGIQVENLNQYPDLPDVAETGTTFEENARLKAETIANLTGRMVLADDSGLKVDILGGLPGVWSARFAGPDATDARNNAKLLHELAMVFDQEKRSAQFHCTLVVAAPQRESLVVEADWDGFIAHVPRGDGGFGYDPLFLVGHTNRTAAEMDLAEKNQISHRALALEKLMEAFPKWQKQSLS